MKTEKQLSTANSSDVDFHNWKPFPEEFIKFTRQLREMKKWFKKYNKAYFSIDGSNLDAYIKLDNCIYDAVWAIAELSQNEFVTTYFNDEDKGKFINVVNEPKKTKIHDHKIPV